MISRALLLVTIILVNLTCVAQARKPKIPVVEFQTMLERKQYEALYHSAIELRNDTLIGKHYILDYYIAMALCNLPGCEEKSAKWWSHLFDSYTPPRNLQILFWHERTTCGNEERGAGMIAALASLGMEAGVTGAGPLDMKDPQNIRVFEEIRVEEQKHKLLMDSLERTRVAGDSMQMQEITAEPQRHEMVLDSLRGLVRRPDYMSHIDKRNEEIGRRNEELDSLGTLIDDTLVTDGWEDYRRQILFDPNEPYTSVVDLLNLPEPDTDSDQPPAPSKPIAPLPFRKEQVVDP